MKHDNFLKARFDTNKNLKANLDTNIILFIKKSSVKVEVDVNKKENKKPETGKYDNLILEEDRKKGSIEF